ncbi:hypothetical protein GV819_21600 [Pseudomonas sp. Fl5BN2]|uniref:hypothetical protein n=1 Tax=Pseudomonas sp. Fl5BN2 TaxID=2697652 RepID=UPI001378F855|nr:hypothetical protein [Pseudomonas sp. Fl5BN2]NBF04885.1 hypothetical protein [Pseudomonas sp. Fl5BN2]
MEIRDPGQQNKDVATLSRDVEHANGNFSQALVGASAPYLAGLIKESITDNLEARVMAHAVLGAVLAKSQENSEFLKNRGAFDSADWLDIYKG